MSKQFSNGEIEFLKFCVAQHLRDAQAGIGAFWMGDIESETSWCDTLLSSLDTASKEPAPAEEHILISVFDREISTEIFPSLKAAQEEMLEQFEKYCGVGNAQIDMEEDYKFEIHDASAWSNLGGSYDWRIVPLGPANMEEKHG